MKITARRKGAPFTRPLEQMYSITEASQEVGVARQTMSRWIKTGRISPVFRVNPTCVRVPVSSVNRFLGRRGRTMRVVTAPTARKPQNNPNFFPAREKRGFGNSVSMIKNTYQSHPEASAPENPSNKTAEGSSENSAALAVALLSIYRPYIPRHFSEAKQVWWLLDADDRRACKVSKFIAPQFDLREAADSAGPKKRVVTMELTDLSKLNSYLRTEGHIELPAPPFGKGYIVVCSAGKVLLSDSDATIFNNVSL